MRLGATKAIAIMPYSDGERSLATIMPPMAARARKLWSELRSSY